MGILGRVIEMVGGRRTVVRLDEAPASGAAEAAVRPLIAELRRAVSPEIRSASTKVYLEGVITRDRLASCTEIVSEALGSPAKPFDERAAFDRTVRAMVDSHGGINKDQCLYLRRFEDGRVAFAALWPWSSSNRITVKVGVYDEEH
ncbi:MAG: hypothetical protein O7J95_15070 [Planctomycetota bacterium]|nr:hypothetical protein [Planctomycetota bacterium]